MPDCEEILAWIIAAIAAAMLAWVYVQVFH
jgi:hypothetical protein